MSSLELLRRAITHSDQDAWAGFQQCLEETVLTWLHEHPSREAACRGLCEKDLVTQAFERFRQVAVQAQMAFETLAGVLVDEDTKDDAVRKTYQRKNEVDNATLRYSQLRYFYPKNEVFSSKKQGGTGPMDNFLKTTDREAPDNQHTDAPALGTTLALYHGQSSEVGALAVAWSPDGQRIASGSDDDSVRVWQAR